LFFGFVKEKMMSVEREVLIKAVEWMHELKHINYEDDHLTNDLIQTIQKLLNQPEQRLTPLTSKLISLGNNCHESFIKGIRFAEKMHGIGGGE
jgi:hypothetical protein